MLYVKYFADSFIYLSMQLAWMKIKNIGRDYQIIIIIIIIILWLYKGFGFFFLTSLTPVVPWREKLFLLTDMIREESPQQLKWALSQCFLSY